MGWEELEDLMEVLEGEAEERLEEELQDELPSDPLPSFTFLLGLFPLHWGGWE